MLLMYNPSPSKFYLWPPTFFFHLSITACQDYFPNFELSQVGQKQMIPKKKTLTIRKQNLACLTCDMKQAQTHTGEMTSDD